MAKTCRQKFILTVIYFVIFSNIVGGMCSIITRGIAPLGGLFLMLGLLAVAGGLILLVGVVKGNHRFILVYIILAVMVLSFTTVLISVLIIPKVKEFKVYVFLSVYVVLVIWWPILYCVHLFYKDLMMNQVVTVVDHAEVKCGDGEECDSCVVIEGTSEN